MSIEGQSHFVEVTKEFKIHASHRLPGHEGKCANQHGHTYKLEVSIEGPVCPDAIEEQNDHFENLSLSMVTDFSTLKSWVEEVILSKLDHTDLNTLFIYPTAEITAIWIADQLEQNAPIEWEAKGIRLSRVRLWETDTSSVLVEV